MQRAARNQAPLSVLMIDVDHFKHINDRHGHPVGDAVLMEFATCLRACVRPYDSMGRYGGDEFIVVLPDTDAATACHVAERLVNAIRQSRFTANGEPVQLTASVGIGSANFADDVASAAELVVRADTALLQVKKKGRNGFGVAEGHPAPEVDPQLA